MAGTISSSFCIKATLPLVSAFCALGLFLFSRTLCKGGLQPAELHVGGDDDAAAALKQVQMLRAEFYKGQSDLLQAMESLRLQVQSVRQGSKDVPMGVSTVTAAPNPSPVELAVAAPPVPTPAPMPLVPVTVGPLFGPTNRLGGEPTGKGPVWDSKVLSVENKAETQYWYQRHEKLAPVHPGFLKYNPNWPCLWGEEYVGKGSGDGNKWTCGARLIQAPCVVYSFGSNGDTKFELGVHDLGLGCEIHIFDPTIGEPPQARAIGAKFHRVGLGANDGFQGRFPVKTLKSIMRDNGHSHIDILKIDIEDAEHQALPQIAADGWPSVGQLLIEIHIRGITTDQHLDRLFDCIEEGNLRLFHEEPNWEMGPACCTEYAFIHKQWRPETKKYDMKKAASYQHITHRQQQLPPQRGWGTSSVFRRRP